MSYVFDLDKEETPVADSPRRASGHLFHLGERQRQPFELPDRVRADNPKEVLIDLVAHGLWQKWGQPARASFRHGLERPQVDLPQRQSIDVAGYAQPIRLLIVDGEFFSYAPTPGPDAAKSGDRLKLVPDPRATPSSSKARPKRETSNTSRDEASATADGK
ncbi:hypothetical protein [Arthrobacter sp. StoSoilB20]|uniref:hypothetical protein n=1 Tax=Arthrobacter sp. StoSoilB20 TaxID=2830995 RepID=UPI001CC496F8|nr:hypothetical protein [Arthrobacter sp. StoSoilB20]